MNNETFWKREERLWLEGASAYAEIVDHSCLMAFPGMGVLQIADVLEGLKVAPRWVSVTMMDRQTSRAGSVFVLGYTAEGQREGSDPYRCFCTSTYCAVGGVWKLVQHQQTLADQYID
ncbi:hypothetical protein REJC140_03584 [Pseudorhizobium endolithicum]|uniref:DUF4440 domain-containing protein n=1 Tax=Pseudorhizobium endolithicum TaxID=1191678 RepID=A0ABM8PLP8_9HYPH|nr:DUF4440 domain-containing protein [Pseudorhizobium endolithicum]CAD6436432.1 nuclear transport factor 2 family protein [Rhizobium sp. Q54]CAD7036830.1 hypothetical protein REJC140_03584 [Pseudorhizobium endolithicum]